MWTIIRDSANVAANVAIALAFIIATVELWFIRNQQLIDAHFSYVQSEREIWLAALHTKDIAPRLIAANWNSTPNVESSEELFLAILLDHFWHAYFRHKHRLVTREAWDMFEGYIVKVLSSSPANAIWNSIKFIYPEDFVAHFDRALHKSMK